MKNVLPPFVREMPIGGVDIGVDLRHGVRDEEELRDQAFIA